VTPSTPLARPSQYRPARGHWGRAGAVFSHVNTERSVTANRTYSVELLQTHHTGEASEHDTVGLPRWLEQGSRSPVGGPEHLGLAVGRRTDRAPGVSASAPAAPQRTRGVVARRIAPERWNPDRGGPPRPSESVSFAGITKTHGCRMPPRVACPQCHSTNKVPVIAEGVEGVYRCGKCRHVIYRVEPTWKPQLASLLAQRERAAALSLLVRVIEQDLPLLWRSPLMFEERRLAWLLRIDLLREAGHLAEALAWLCLECTLTPQNVSAAVLRERLTTELCLRGARPPTAGKGGALRCPADDWPGVAGMRDLKAILLRDVILPLQEPDRYRRYGLMLPNGVLLYGPSGCGKMYRSRFLGHDVRMVRPPPPLPGGSSSQDDGVAPG